MARVGTAKGVSEVTNDELSAIEARIERDVPALLAEVRRLEAEHAVVYCVFCGHKENLGNLRGEESRVAAMEAMAAHVMACEMHPMNMAARENQRLTKENAELKQRREKP